MINSKELDQINKRLRTYDSKREILIKKSRDVLKLSKEIIFGLHRGSSVEGKIKLIKKEVKKLNLENEGSYRIAVQEYVEALAFYKFINEKKLLTLKEVKVQDTLYLLGIMDVSGEIFRFAMNSAIRGDYKTPVICLEFLDSLYGSLLKFDIRRSELRKKFDSIKYDLQKLENLVLSLKLKK
jgi:predicted translin family RNA/ssDNA-binding protein